MKTDLQYIFGMLEYKKDKEKLTKYIEQHREFFENVDLDTYYAAKALLGSDRKLKEFKQEGEKVNMCKALEDLYQEGREEGREDKVKELVQKKLAKGKSANEIAEALEEDVEVIMHLIEGLKNN